MHAGHVAEFTDKCCQRSGFGAAFAVLLHAVTPFHAGTTIAGVHELEKAGVRSAFMSAVMSASARADELAKL